MTTRAARTLIAALATLALGAAAAFGWLYYSTRADLADAEATAREYQRAAESSAEAAERAMAERERTERIAAELATQRTRRAAEFDELRADLRDAADPGDLDAEVRDLRADIHDLAADAEAAYAACRDAPIPDPIRHRLRDAATGGEDGDD